MKNKSKILDEFDEKTKQGKFGLSLGVSPDDFFAVKNFISQKIDEIINEVKMEKKSEGISVFNYISKIDVDERKGYNSAVEELDTKIKEINI